MPHDTAPARPLLTGVLLVGSVACFVTMVFLFRHGIQTNLFPSYIAGGPPVEVRRYSAPWIAGSIGVFGLGGLLLIAALGTISRPPDLRTQADTSAPSATSWSAGAVHG